jgi:hypothetical protein
VSSPEFRPGKLPPGPWGWFGNGGNGQLYLATQHSGRVYVMSFDRWGMRSAQPVFRVTDGKYGRLIDAADLLKFEVGDRGVRGINAAKADPSVYRYDISGIDHPVARAIEKIPELTACLADCLLKLSGEGALTKSTLEQTLRTGMDLLKYIEHEEITLSS